MASASAGNAAEIILIYSLAAVGHPKVLLYIPERSKQHGLRLPLASMSHAAAIRVTRVRASLPDVIQ